MINHPPAASPPKDAIPSKDVLPPKKLALLGGDLRQMITAKTLAADGYEVAVFAMDTYAGDWGNVTRAADLQSAVGGADLVVLPLPVTRDGERLHSPLSRDTVPLEEVFRLLTPGQHVVGGNRHVVVGVQYPIVSDGQRHEPRLLLICQLIDNDVLVHHVGFLLSRSFGAQSLNRISLRVTSSSCT